MNRFLKGFLFFLLFIPQSLFAQESQIQGTNPAYLKWYQVNTEHFRLLYPNSFDREAQRVANTLEHIYEPESKSLGAHPKKISVLLQNQSSVSNGFVTLAPRRSEFYTMPSQDYNFTSTNDWLSLLAAHEYRHIVQFQKSITGFNKAVYYAFGQTALAGMAFVSAPLWFWEGDAVATETAFTSGGRGKIPNFNLLFRTNLLEGRTFDYHKQYVRSYKHNIPNHYVLGYNMISYLRNKTGNPDIWGAIAKRSWDVPFIPFAFSRAIKKETGMNVNELYREMVADRKKEWQVQVDTLKLTSFDRVNHRKSTTYTDYANPQPLPDGSIAVIKSGLDHIAQVVVISPDGQEKKMLSQGPVNDAGMLSTANNNVVWNEFRYDPRWQVKTYSVIKSFDTQSKKSKTITKHTRYSAAALSPDGEKLVTIETNSSYQMKIVVLSYPAGEILKEFPIQSKDFISMPRWSDDGKSIVALKTNSGMRSVVRYEYETQVSTEILQAGKENVGHPVLFQKYLYYSSPYRGIDNIYAVDLATGKRFQITTSKYGAYNPAVSPDGKTLFYNDQTRDGLDVVKIEINPSQWTPLENSSPVVDKYSKTLEEQEGNPDLLKTVPSNTYPVTKFNKAAHLFNIHTWGPYFISDISKLNVGISSKDLLSTAVLNVGYEYDASERTGSFKTSVSYQGQYPIVDVQYIEGGRSVSEGNYQFGTQSKEVKFEWHERNVEVGLRIPIVTTRSVYVSSISVGNYLGITKVNDFKNSIDGGGRLIPTSSTSAYFFRSYVDNGMLLYNHAFFSARRQWVTNKRDIYSRWGQTINVHYYSTPYGGDFKGGLFSTTASLYFPGFANHHSFNGFVAYQASQIVQEPDNYLFRNAVPTPRGQSVSRFQDFYSTSANYTFPIAYPDLRLGPILDIQRVTGNVFGDYAFGKSKSYNSQQAYTSVGAEIKFDFNVMRFIEQFNVGVRYIYTVEQGASQYEIVLGNIGF